MLLPSSLGKKRFASSFRVAVHAQTMHIWASTVDLIDNSGAVTYACMFDDLTAGTVMVSRRHTAEICEFTNSTSDLSLIIVTI